MGDKRRYYWHKKWRCTENGVCLIHDSGLQFHLVNGAWQYLETTYPVFFESEIARGVPQWQLKGRLMQLTKEAQRWANDPRQHKKFPALKAYILAETQHDQSE